MRKAGKALGCFRIVALAVVVAAGLAAIDGFLIEPHWLKVSRVTIRSNKLTQPVRVVLLADIQTDRPGRYEARVLQTAAAQQPDLVLFAGDYLHLSLKSRGYAAEATALRDLIAESGLAAPLGMYAIAGNIDPPPRWHAVFEDLPVTLIDKTTSYGLGPVVLTGLSKDQSFRDEGVPIAPDTDAAQDTFHIVLGHSPNYSLGPVAADLLLAGHTHGGQVQIPFFGPLITLSVVPRAWASGVTEIAPGKTLIVSRGIGMERGWYAPKVRFFCRPELVVIDLVPAQG